MLIVLGFAVATFLALIVGRLAWKLAVRIGARRVQQNVPVTVVDLQNDRDRLRAEQAILARKIEVRLDEMKLRMAEQSAEVTRNRNRVETLMQQVADQDVVIAARDSEIARLNGLIAGTQRELDKVKTSSVGLEKSLQARDVEMAGLHEKFLSKLDEARLPPAAAAAPVVQQSLDESNARLTSRIREITSISNEMSGTKPPPSDGNVNTADVTNSIFVKPANSQQLHAKAKAKPSKKAPRASASAAAAAVDEQPLVEQATPVAAETPAEAPEDKAEDKPVAKEARPVTNVISLAQRIKALQREIAG